MRPLRVLFLCLTCLLASPPLHAGGRLLATGGVMQLEGQAGGGLTPWAVTAGYGTRDEWGGSVGWTRVATDDYTLDVRGVALTFHDRLEVSFARQDLALDTLGALIGLPGHVLSQDVFGVKWRITGDALFEPLPQLALGIQHKRHRDFLVPAIVGARDDTGTDVYLSATQVLFGAGFGGNLVLSGTLRSTAANQLGILGYGGDLGGRETVLEGSAAVLWGRHWVTGVEYRQKPDNLSFAREEAFADVFIAWFPVQRWSFVLAWARLGDVASLPDQSGIYLSAQVNW